MERLEREISELHQAEKRRKQEELRAAEESQRLVSGLETDLQKLLEEKKSQLKVCSLLTCSIPVFNVTRYSINW